MSPRHARWLSYLMLLLLSLMVGTGKTEPTDGLWCAAFATMLMFAASGIETEGQDGATRLGAKHESPTAEGGDAKPLSSLNHPIKE
jgi:hypothetical protein